MARGIKKFLIKRLSSFEKRPWGEFFNLAESAKKWRVKILHIKKGRRFSLQSHKLRDEQWTVAEGKVRVIKGKNEFWLNVGDRLVVKRGEKHRIFAQTTAVVVEVSFGKFLERDIIRFEDDYGRAEKI